MPREDGAEPNVQQNGERMFVIVAVVMCVILGTGFCAVLLLLNYRGQSQDASTDNLPDSRPAFIQPDHPRNLVDFALVDSAGHSVTRTNLDGKILVVDFLFTSCSLTCPAVNAQ